jgi:hypothetical protein
MSNWTLAEIESIERSGGNVRDRDVYFASYDPIKYPRPSSSDRNKLRDFIRLKYIEKKWVAKSEPSSPVRQESQMSPRDPESEGKRKKEKKEKKAKENRDVSNDLVSFDYPTSSKSCRDLSAPPLVEQEEEIQMQFSRGIELLHKLQDRNPDLARSIANNLIDSLRVTLSNNNTPVSSHVVTTSTAEQTVVGSNPFDFLPPALPTLLVPPVAVVKPPTQSTQPLIGLLSPKSTNPFDFPL